MLQLISIRKPIFLIYQPSAKQVFSRNLNQNVLRMFFSQLSTFKCFLKLYQPFPKMFGIFLCKNFREHCMGICKDQQIHRKTNFQPIRF